MEEKFADAVVVAAGSSRRMGGVDKLDADLDGRPLLEWSVRAMADAVSVKRVIVVSGPERLEALRASRWMAELGVIAVAGGAERTDSVLAGVRASDADVVLVHDGARPLATPDLADAVARATVEYGAAVPILPVADSLKSIRDGRITGVIERESVAVAQTPQGARRDLLMAAAVAGVKFTDEAAMLQAHGVDLAVVPGEATNIKVTRPDDLVLARALAGARSARSGTRTGFGEDTHQFGPVDGLWLGGIFVAEAPRLRGHSDGDAVLHALATAVLASAGLGDIGRLFPAGERGTSGARSTDLLRAAVYRVTEAGWRPATVTISISGARPRLGGARLDEMSATIAAALGLPPDVVAVTASSGNLSGPTGSGLAVSATAIVTSVRK